MNNPRHLLSLATLAFLLLAPSARADDWPQWLGPQRDGVWRETGILEKFPEGGPKIRWRVPVGAGYSSPAVVGNRVYLTDRVAKPGAPKAPSPFARISTPGVERVLCLDAADGKTVWSQEYPCDYTMSYNAGPRAAPVIEGERVYTLGAEGDLQCRDAKSGKLIWQQHLGGENGAHTPMWGFAASPLIEGDKLITLGSGPEGVAVAFNKETGAPLWKALPAKEPGYCAPIVIEAGGKRQLIVFHPEGLNSLDPDTGK
ncbi:MAG: qedA, partial [Phycisphaerales bacterium]|nr:qedA [Phycisphaerales bacterium]